MEDRPKRFLADDPNFLASLSELDRGMPESPDAAPAKSPPPARPPAPAPPPATVKFQQPPLAPPSPPPVTTPPAARRSSSADVPRGPRPLLDLFPVMAEQTPATSSRSFDLLSMREPARTFAPAPRPIEPATYETFYGLHERPFSLAASDLKFLYHSAAHDRAAQSMLASIWRREGIVVLTGDPGVGKTMLCRAVIEQLDRRTLTSFVSEPFASAENLLETVLVDFGVISRADVAAGRLARATRAELSTALRDFLFSLAPLQAFAVVIIDEAQDLPADVLEHMRVLVDAEGDERLLQVVLVGQPGLLATLARGELKPLAERVSVRCTLGPLAADEVAGYVGHRVSVAGASPRVEFDDRAIERLYEFSRGVPRMVNLLCDRALSAGYRVSASAIDDRLIESAAEDLDLAPPLTGGSLARLAALVVILGVLIVAGAAAAAYVLRADVAAVVADWQDIPAPPAAPSPVPRPTLPAVVPPTGC